MRVVVLGVLVFLLLISSGNVSAQSGLGVVTGSTRINTTVLWTGELNLSLENPEILIPEDYYFHENLTLFQTDTQNVSAYLNKTDANGFVKFADDSNYHENRTLYLPVNTYENATLRVYVPSGMGYEGGTYYVTLYAYSLNDSRSNSTTLEINVNNTSPVDYVDIINLYPSSLYQGESITANISIHKLYPADTTDLQICYCINANPTYQCGPSFNNYGCEWKTAKEWINYTKTLIVGESPGEYYFFVAVKYPGDPEIKRAISPKFLVKKVPGPPPGGGAPSLPSVFRPVLEIISANYLEAAPGERIRFEAEVRNTGNVNALNTSLNVYGIPESWVYVTPFIEDIEIDGSQNYSVLITLPTTATEQIYQLSLVAKSGTVEASKIVTLTVAWTSKKKADFLISEAEVKKTEAEGAIEIAKGWGMDTSEPETTLDFANQLLDETNRLFKLGNYGEAIGKAMQAIDSYKSVISSVKEMVERAFLSLMDILNAELGYFRGLTEERDVIGSIERKLTEGDSLQRQERMIDAYRLLLEAKQLLDQLKGKIFFMGLTQNVVIIAILAVIVVAASMVFFYKKRMSRFLRTVKIEEHKKTIKHLFKKEVKPSVPPKKKPAVDREKLTEIRRFLEKGESVVGTDAEGAKDAYTEARKIYNSLSSGERRLIGDEGIRLMRLYNNIMKQSR